MSYDLQVWSAEPVSLPPSPDGWSAEGAAWLKSRPKQAHHHLELDACGRRGCA